MVIGRVAQVKTQSQSNLLLSPFWKRPRPRFIDVLLHKWTTNLWETRTICTLFLLKFVSGVACGGDALKGETKNDGVV